MNNKLFYKKVIVVFMSFLFLLTLVACNKIDKYEEQLQFYHNQETEYNDGNFNLDYDKFCEYIVKKCDNKFEISNVKNTEDAKTMLFTNKSEKIYIEIHHYTNIEFAEKDYYLRLCRNATRNYQYYILLRFSDYIINVIGKPGCEFIKKNINFDIPKYNKVEINKSIIHLDYNEINEDKFITSKNESTIIGEYTIETIVTYNGFILQGINNDKQNVILTCTENLWFNDNIRTGVIVYIDNMDHTSGYVLYSNNKSFIDAYINAIKK